VNGAGEIVIPILAIVAFPAFVVSAFLGSRAQVKLITLLREHLREVWRSLDSPTPVSHFSAGGYFALMVWVLKASYESTRDPEIMKYGAQLRVSLFTEIVSLVVFLLAVA